MNTLVQQVSNYIRAGNSGLCLTSYEEARVEGDIVTVAKQLGFSLHAWSITRGVVDMRSGLPTEGTDEPLKALDHFESLKEKSILLMRDFHFFVGEPNPLLIRRVKEALLTGKNSNRVLIVLGCQLKLVPELEKEFTVIEVKLPDRKQLLEVAQTIAQSANIELNGGTDALLDAASGLTTVEAADAFSLAAVESAGKELSAAVVAREKAATIRKNGLLEVVETTTTLADIGGLENLKAHLFSIRRSFSKEARDYGLPSPRPGLFVGQAGVGKSLCATACGNIFGVPLLRLEAGRLFGSLVGESERNWRTAFATAKAIAPCCVHVDEVDGLFSGGESSGKTDGGTTSRVIKAILQDLQFNSEGIFFAFTANDIDNLPDPLIDRCDVWSVDLPTQTEREAVWKIQIAKRGRKPSKYNLKEFASLTEGFSGRQIEQAWIRAMSMAFNSDGREPKDADVVECLSHFVPTSKTMADSIERRRKRLAGRAQPASKAEVAALPPNRKLVA